MSKERIFFNCFCYGAAATTWLARMLNCHEDFLCLHTPEYPGADLKDEEYLYTMARYTYDSTALGGPPYKYIGFTHGISYTALGRLNDMFGSERVRGFVMVRHPVARAASILALRLQQAESHKMFRPEACLDKFYKLLCARTGRADFAADYESLCFYELCGQLIGAVTKEKATGVPLFTMEKLTAEPAEVNRLLAYISDGKSRLDEGLIARVQKRPVGAHAKKRLSPQEIFDSWNGDRQTAFLAMVGNEALCLYRELGYELALQW